MTLEENIDTELDGDPVLDTEEDLDSDLKTESETPTDLESSDPEALQGELDFDPPLPPPPKTSAFRLSIKVAEDPSVEELREGLDGFDPEAEELVAILTVGVSASGKSTWARKFAELHPNFVEINRDNMREIYWDDKFPDKPFSFKNWNFREWEPHINKMVDLAIKDASANQQSIIISDTNLTDKFREEMISKLKSLGYKVITKDFDIELDEALRRNEGRGTTVGPDIIRRQFEQYKSYKDKKQASAGLTLSKSAKAKLPLFKK